MLQLTLLETEECKYGLHRVSGLLDRSFSFLSGLSCAASPVVPSLMRNLWDAGNDGKEHESGPCAWTGLSVVNLVPRASAFRSAVTKLPRIAASGNEVGQSSKIVEACWIFSRKVTSRTQDTYFITWNFHNTLISRIWSDHLIFAISSKISRDFIERSYQIFACVTVYVAIKR